MAWGEGEVIPTGAPPHGIILMGGSGPRRWGRRMVTVIVMTFWYVYWNRLKLFQKLFKLYLHLGLITTPHAFYVHMTYDYSFLMLQPSHDHMAK